MSKKYLIVDDMNITHRAMMLGLVGLAALDPRVKEANPEIEVNTGGREAEEKKWRKNTGQKEFTIDGITVWARDFKNAQRKVNNIKKG